MAEKNPEEAIGESATQLLQKIPDNGTGRCQYHGMTTKKKIDYGGLVREVSENGIRRVGHCCDMPDLWFVEVCGRN